MSRCCRFDLRFVPDEQHFSGREVRDEATEMPASYKPPEVGAASMLHTNPKLTWDAEDDSRKKALLQRVSKEKLRDDDFKVYLVVLPDSRYQRFCARATGDTV